MRLAAEGQGINCLIQVISFIKLGKLVDPENDVT